MPSELFCIVVELDKSATAEEINRVLTEASKTARYKGIIGVSDEPLVSSDFVGDTNSGIVDLLSTKVIDGDLAKVVIWYDNEFGYANRLIEITEKFGA